MKKSILIVALSLFSSAIFAQDKYSIVKARFGAITPVDSSAFYSIHINIEIHPTDGIAENFVKAIDVSFPKIITVEEANNRCKAAVINFMDQINN